MNNLLNLHILIICLPCKIIRKGLELIMFLKLLVSFFSIIILIKNLSYAMYEHRINKNAIGSASICVTSLLGVVILNVVLFFINF